MNIIRAVYIHTDILHSNKLIIIHTFLEDDSRFLVFPHKYNNHPLDSSMARKISSTFIPPTTTKMHSSQHKHQPRQKLLNNRDTHASSVFVCVCVCLCQRDRERSLESRALWDERVSRPHCLEMMRIQPERGGGGGGGGAELCASSFLLL